MSQECRQHHFYQHGRCWFCQMKEEYQQRGLEALKHWTKEEIRSDNEHYKSVRANFENCRPHVHSNPKVSDAKSEEKRK